MMTQTPLQDRIRGSVVGGAVGDALGYAVEFFGLDHIHERFGKDGITRYVLRKDGEAKFSDDTQMTLFTAEGLLNAYAGNKDYVSHIRQAYVEWYHTQYDKPGSIPQPKCRLCNVPALYTPRAPGNTCISALANIIAGREVNNDSKGCGGIMRVAPIALFGASHNIGLKESTLLGCQAAAITHLHPMGWLPAGLMVYVLQNLVTAEHPTREMLEGFVLSGIDMLEEIFSEKSDEYTEYIAELKQWSEAAIRLSKSEFSDIECVARLGEGWVGDECWYIALYCALRYLDDFESAIVASVNHSGDSDSTGAVCGNLVGAVCGYEAIPTHYKEHLEMLPLLVEEADCLSGSHLL